MRTGSSTAAERDQGLTTKTAKSAPYVMPAVHGGSIHAMVRLTCRKPDATYRPNSTRPINPDMIRPLQFVAGPADENLVVAVKALLERRTDHIWWSNRSRWRKLSMDMMSSVRPIILDEITGE